MITYKEGSSEPPYTTSVDVTGPLLPVSPNNLDDSPKGLVWLRSRWDEYVANPFGLSWEYWRSGESDMGNQTEVQ